MRGQPDALKVLATAVDHLGAEAVTLKADAKRSEARGYTILAADLFTMASRLERLAGELASAMAPREAA